MWYSDAERIELSGHVLSMWSAKTAGLLLSEAGPGPRVSVALAPGWRAVTWCLGAWLAAGTVLAADVDPCDPALGLDGPLVSVAGDPADLLDDAEVQILVPPASLAVRWPGELPPLVLDGAADVMVHPDRMSPLPCDQAHPALVVADLPGDSGASGEALSPGGARGAARVVSRADLLCAARAGAPGGRARLIRAGTVAQMLPGVLSAWAARAAAILVSPEANESLVTAAARQEGIS